MIGQEMKTIDGSQHAEIPAVAHQGPRKVVIVRDQY